MANTIAREILRQLGGGNKLAAMIGAHGFTSEGRDLSFAFKGSREANRVKITLNELDLYTVEFFKFSPKTLACPMVKELPMVDCAELTRCFELVTGLYLSI